MTTTSKFLVLRLAGSRLFFGKTRIDNYIKTNRIPPKSQIVGLLANALGYDRQDIEIQTAFQNRIFDREGILENDFQTVDKDLCYKRAGVDTVLDGTKRLKYNTYLSDGIYMVAVELSPAENPNDVSLEGLWNALENPARTLFIGHKDCLPSMKIGLGIFEAENLEQLMTKIPRLRTWDQTPATTTKSSLECWLPIRNPSEFENLTAKDKIEEFNDEYDHLNKIHGGQRWMKRRFIELATDQVSLGGRNFENTKTRKSTRNVELLLDDKATVFLKSALDFPKKNKAYKRNDAMNTTDITLENEQPIETMYEITLLKDAQIMRKLAIAHKPNNRGILESDLTKDYIAHVLVSCLFGIKAPSTFSIQELDVNTIEIKMNSQYSLAELKEIAYAKNVDHQNNYMSLDAVLWNEAHERALGNWQQGQSLKIELVLNPIRRRDEKYYDAYETFQKYIGILRSSENPTMSVQEIEKLANLSREEIYANWLLERFANFDFVKLENVITTAFGMESVARKDSRRNLKAIEQPIARFIGELTILDPSKMNELLAKGVGRQKGFGRGMLKIVSNP